jgi:hypothetical protein
MVTFFFYNKLTNIELLKKINIHFKINDGYVLIQNYDSEKKILEISDKSINNNTVLHGKIVIFDTTLDDVIKQINQINEIEKCNFEHTKCTLETIWPNDVFGIVSTAYIIY